MGDRKGSVAVRKLSSRPVLAGAAILALGLVTACSPEGRQGGESAAGTIRVGILVYQGVFNTEFIAPLDIFTHTAGRLDGRMEVFTVSPGEGAVRTAEGLRVTADYNFGNAPGIDWLVVPSGENYRTDIENRKLVAWIAEVGGRAEVVHSNCWGAFLLAAAGLLDGREATTFPASLDEFAGQFPKISVQRDLILVDDSGAVTTAGGVISYDGALYLVEKHFGPEMAEAVASGLVIDWEQRRKEFAQLANR